MKALILAAGLGTRLRPLTEKFAKPALPVIGVPSFWYAAWHLRNELGVDKIAMNMGHASDSLRRAGDDVELRKFTGITFHYSDESAKILGSSGALKKLSKWIDGDLLAVTNGDTISRPSWKKMLAFHEERKATVTLHARKFDDATSDEMYTTLDIDANGRVLRFGPKAKSGKMFSGSYLFSPSALRFLPEGVSELRPTVLEPLIEEQKLFAFQEEVDWLDTGTIGAFADAQFELLKRMPQWRKLVEVKMREDSEGCWVPRRWRKLDIELNGPVVLTGDQETWGRVASSYGPRFIGIEEPSFDGTTPTENALVCSGHIHNL
jgi:mannose-1-phosphate guanylyltransferase